MLINNLRMLAQERGGGRQVENSMASIIFRGGQVQKGGAGYHFNEFLDAHTDVHWYGKELDGTHDDI